MLRVEHEGLNKGVNEEETQRVQKNSFDESVGEFKTERVRPQEVRVEERSGLGDNKRCDDV